MQHGAVFGEVDGLAGEHLLALGLDTAFACELFEKRDDLLVDGTFGVIHQQVIEFDAETAESLVVGRKSGAQIGCGCAACRCFQFFDGGLHLMLLGFRGRMRKLFFFRRPNQGDFDKRKEPVARLPLVQFRLRNSRRKILPTFDFGRSVRNSIIFGRL